MSFYQARMTGKQSPFITGIRVPSRFAAGAVVFPSSGSPFCWRVSSSCRFPLGSSRRGSVGAPVFHLFRPVWLGVCRRRDRSRLRAQRDHPRPRQGAHRSVVGASHAHEAREYLLDADPAGGDGLLSAATATPPQPGP